MRGIRHAVLVAVFAIAVQGGGRCDARAEALSIAAVAGLSYLEVAARPAVTVRGQVIALRPAADGEEIVVEDAGGGIRVVVNGRETTVDGPAPSLEPGAEVEVSGTVGPGGFSPLLHAVRIVVTGHRALPTPRRCDPEGFFSGSEECRLIEVEGIVEQAWREDGDLHLEIQTAGRLFTAIVSADLLASLPEVEGAPQRLVDAVLRVAGAASSVCNQRDEIVRPVVRVDRREWFTIIEPARDPVFKTAAMSLESIGRFRPEAAGGHRVRTFGQVIHAEPGQTLFLQNGHSGIRVGLGAGAPGSAERIAVGDNVEVAGFLDRSGGVVAIRNATATRFAAVTKPVALRATPAAILAANGGGRDPAMIAAPGDYDGCLVSFSAHLLQAQPTIDGGVLLLRAVDAIVTVEADRDTYAAIAGTAPLSVVEVTGVATVEREPPGRSGAALPRHLRLLLRSPADFRLLHRPPWWTPARLLAVLGIVGVVLVTALGWALTLRRQLVAQTRLLASEMRSRRDAALEFEATLRERNRLAANLHDTLQQTIGGIGFQLDACASAGDGKGFDVNRHLTVARRMVDHAATELQGSVWAMRSLPLDGKPFGEALRGLVSRVAEGHDVLLSVRTEGPFGDVPEFVSGTVLLLVQESLHNALKHGSPKTIEVTVTDDPSLGTLRAVVSDDGRGFVVRAAAGPHDGHFGIQGMRDRAEKLGGHLSVRSRPGGGTTVEAIVQRREYDADLDTPTPRLE
jgi:signal transduction histidine kinase